jgi:capsid protein
MREIKKKSNRGGKREGAGRPRKNQIQLVDGNTGQATDFHAWETAVRQPGRAYIYMPTIQPQREFFAGTREQLIRKARWLYNNHGFARRIVNGIARYTVGTGLWPIPRTNDPDWNRQVADAFEQNNCTEPFAFDVAAQVNFASAQMLAMRQVICDGEFFWQPVLSQTGRGMVRFLGAEKVKNSNKSGLDQSDFIDGVKLGKFGRPEKYRVVTDMEGIEYQDIPAGDIYCISRLHRHGYVRQPSWLAGAANKIQDIGEIQNYLQQSFKMGAQIGFVIYSPEAGQIGLGTQLRKTAGLGVGGEGQPTGPQQITTDMLYAQSGVPQLKPGEKIESFSSDQPGQTFAPLMDAMSRDIAWSADVSPELLWNIAGIGGANTRYVLADGQSFFEELQNNVVVTQFCRPFYKFWLWNEIEAGRIPAKDDWWRHEWGTPRKATVDYGRDTAVLLKLTEANILSPDTVSALLGYDLEHQDRAKIERYVMRQTMVAEASKKSGIPMTYEDLFTTESERVAEIKAGDEPGPDPSAAPA